MTTMDDYGHLKERDFGLTKEQVSDIEDLIGTRQSLSDEEYGKVIEVLKMCQNVRDMKELKDQVIALRKRLRYQPSKVKLARVFFDNLCRNGWVRPDRGG